MENTNNPLEDKKPLRDQKKFKDFKSFRKLIGDKLPISKKKKTAQAAQQEQKTYEQKPRHSKPSTQAQPQVQNKPHVKRPEQPIREKKNHPRPQHNNSQKKAKKPFRVQTKKDFGSKKPNKYAHKNKNYSAKNTGSSSKGIMHYGRKIDYSYAWYPGESYEYPYPKNLAEGAVRIVPLGGCDAIGKNSVMIEYRDHIVIIDLGLQFPNTYMKGINYVIPDMNYVYKSKKKVKAVFITHGHLDHIGAIPHVMEKLGNPPIYTKALTKAMILKRQERGAAELTVHEVKDTDTIQAGHFKVEFYPVNHTIPDCMAIVVHTPVGTIIHTGDWKYDPKPINEPALDWSYLEDLGRRHNILCLIADSTNVDSPGWQMSETDITENLDILFAKAKGRVFVGTFSSLLSRIQQIVRLAEKYNRKIVVDGRSMKGNMEIAKKLQKITYNEAVFISPQESSKYQDENLVIVCTGAQGEENASLMRIATKRHRFFEFQKGDTVIFSSSVVPGNEQSVQMVMDLIYRRGGRVYNYREMDIHAGGHACAEEIKKLYNALKPKYYIPFHGTHSKLVLHAELIEEEGLPRENIFIADNGQPMEFYPDGSAQLTRFSTGNKLVAVDGLGVGDIGPLVLQERKIMGENGIFTIVLTVDKITKELRTSPDVISRGFIFMKTNEKLVNAARDIAKKAFKKHIHLLANDTNGLRNKIRIAVEQYLYKELEREPMVLPVIIKV